MRWGVIVLVVAVGLSFGSSGGVAGQTEPQDVHALIAMVSGNAGDLYVVDIRPKPTYLAGSVPGAISVPADPSGFIADGRGGPALIVAGAESSPLQVAAWRQRLETFGFAPVYQIEGGFDAWVAAGGPVEKPADAYVKPGTLPFIIPRGICELNVPAQVYE